MNQLALSKPLPFELIELPSNIDGTNGVNRNKGNGKLINANNDLQAIQCWLEEFEDSPQTYRNYRKEIERVLLWSLLAINKPFSSLNKDDLKQYSHFLASPTPVDQWCGNRRARSHPDWKPFVGALSEASIHQALTILGAAFGYLSDAGYLLGNPVKLLRRRGRKLEQESTVERFLEKELWDYLWEFISHQPADTPRDAEHKARNLFLFHLLYQLSPRVSEVSNLRMNDFRESKGRWWCHILGKGNKRAKVPVPPTMLNALIEYRRFLKLSDLPTLLEDKPALHSIKGNRNLTSNMIYRIVKGTVQKAADELMCTKPDKAFKLRQSSTHWFRHTSLTHQADRGVEIRYLMKSARHNDINTTSRYIHLEDEKWHDEMTVLHRE